MTKVVLAHGIFGHKDEHWFSWLDKQLTAQGHSVWRQTLPKPDAPQPAEWTDSLALALEPGTIFIGHSLGLPAGLLALQQNPVPLRAIYSIAGFCTTPQNEFTPLMRSFTDLGFNWSKIADLCPNWHVWTADDDPYLGESYSEQIISELKQAGVRVSDYQVFPNRNHLGTWEGSEGKFVELLESLQNHLD